MLTGVKKGEMGKDLCRNLLKTFLENIDRRSCNDGSQELIPVFHDPYRKGRSSPSAVARTLENLDGVPSKAATSGREKNKFGSISKRPVNILKAVIRSGRIRCHCKE